MTPVKIDAEFKALIPPLTPEEYRQLEANILAEGCRDALVVWTLDPFGESPLLDGHNRFEICQAHGYKFDIKSLGAEEIPNRQAAMNWIINNQLGRRNLHPDQASYLRGKRYNAEKQAHGGQVAGIYQNDKSVNTHERLAEEYKVSPATITRDGQYAAAPAQKFKIRGRILVCLELRSAWRIAALDCLNPAPPVRGWEVGGTKPNSDWGR